MPWPRASCGDSTTSFALHPVKSSSRCRSQEKFRRDPAAATAEWGTTTRDIQKGHGLRALADGERELLISRLPPHYMLHAYANCFDRDERQPDFVPWTAAWHAPCGRAQWLRDRPQCIRMGVQALLLMMRRHLVYISEQECKRARAPYKLPKDILRQAFWRVDAQRTGYVSLAQFMQVRAKTPLHCFISTSTHAPVSLPYFVGRIWYRRRAGCAL